MIKKQKTDEKKWVTKDKCLWGIVLLLIICLCLSGGYWLGNSREEKLEFVNNNTTDKEYVLYLGLNNKDTNKQEIDTERAKEKVREILLEFVNEYTLQEAEGGWTSEDNIFYRETTIICILKNVDSKKLPLLLEKLLKEFNQECILVEEDSLWETFYYGKDEENVKNRK